MMVGEPFSPYNLFNGVFIPECLVSYNGISPAAKICWARLCRYAGNKVSCFPSQDDIAEKLGVSVRSISSYLKELEADGFISINQRGLRTSNEYTILRHRLFVEALGGTVADQDAQDPSGQDAQDPSGPTYRTEESQSKRVNTLSGSAILPASQEENPEEEPLSFQDMLHRYVRRKGLSKPNKAVRAKAEETWQKTALGPTDCDAALDGFVASGWWKTASEPLLGFVKDPLSWIRPREPENEASAATGLKKAPGGTTSVADAPESVPARIDYPARWNELVPAMPVEWDWKRSNVDALRLAELDDVFVARFDEICARVQKIHAARPGDQKYMTFNWILKREGRNGPYNWWKVLQDFEWMETPDKPRQGISEIRKPGAWQPGMACNSDEDFDQMRAWKEKRRAQSKHTDPDRAAEEGDIT